MYLKAALICEGCTALHPKKVKYLDKSVKLQPSDCAWGKTGDRRDVPRAFSQKVKENKCNVPSVPGLWSFKPPPPTLRFPERTGVALRSDLAHDYHQTSNFLFRLRQLGNNCGNFIEYLVPAFQLPAILCALHGFISNVGEFRLAVSEILKDGHVVGTVYGLMFFS